VKKLSIVILNYNDFNLTKECVDSILTSVKSSSSSGLQLEIVVVNNGPKNKISADQILSEQSELIPNVTVINNNRNLGFTGGNNVGIKHALDYGADYIMLLNNDTLIKNPFWQSMINYLESNLEVGILGPKIYFAPGYEFHKNKYSEKDQGKVIWYAGGEIDWGNVYSSHRGVDEVDQGQYDEIDETDFISGCCLLGRRKVWEAVGLLEDKYFLYYEDSDYSMRVKKHGWKTVFFPKAKIWHKNAGSSQCGGVLQDYFITRNRLLFGMRWAPLKSKLALIRESIKLLFTGRKWQKIGIRDFYLGKFGRGSWRE